MIEQGGLQVLIRAGSDGHVLRTLPNTHHAKNTEFVEVSNGVPLCVSVKILSSFSWGEATAVSMHVKLGTATSLRSQRIYKPSELGDVVVEVEKWNMWDSQRKEWVAASFEFRDLLDIRRTNHVHEGQAQNLGSIIVSFVRIKILEDDTKYPWPKTVIDTDTKTIHRSISVTDPRDFLTPIRGLVPRECLYDIGKLEYVIRTSKQEAIQNVTASETGKAEQLDSRLWSSWMHFEFWYRSSRTMRNAVHMLRSRKLNELTPPQALALKVWSAKRHKQYDVARGTLLEREAAVENSQLPDTCSVNPTGSGEGLTCGSSNLEQVWSVCPRKKRWSPPPLSPSESESDSSLSSIASGYASAPTSPTRLPHALPTSITPKRNCSPTFFRVYNSLLLAEQSKERTYSAAREARSATTARKREPDLPVLNASLTNESQPRSASVELIKPSDAKMKREHSLIDESPEQASSYRIKELEAKRARLDREIRMEKLMAERDELDMELVRLRRHG